MWLEQQFLFFFSSQPMADEVEIQCCLVFTHAKKRSKIWGVEDI